MPCSGASHALCSAMMKSNKLQERHRSTRHSQKREVNKWRASQKTSARAQVSFKRCTSEPSRMSRECRTNKKNPDVYSVLLETFLARSHSYYNPVGRTPTVYHTASLKITHTVQYSVQYSTV
jgi:hypothetical protein